MEPTARNSLIVFLLLTFALSSIFYIWSLGTLSINGKQVGAGKLTRTIPFIYGVETADVGLDLYSPVTTAYAKGNNAFTGKIKKVTIAVK